MGYIRIESHQKVVTDARVFYVDGDEETDISSSVQVVDLHLEVGAVATATLRAVVGSASVTAQVEDVIVHRLKGRPNPMPSSPPPGFAIPETKEVTTMADRERKVGWV